MHFVAKIFDKNELKEITPEYLSGKDESIKNLIFKIIDCIGKEQNAELDFEEIYESDNYSLKFSDTLHGPRGRSYLITILNKENAGSVLSLVFTVDQVTTTRSEPMNERDCKIIIENNTYGISIDVDALRLHTPVLHSTRELIQSMCIADL